MGYRLVFDPSVYLVGRQFVVRDALQQFLNDEDAPDWRTDTDVPAQELAEVAGRCCYLSFKSPRPGGNKAYLDHILESGHHSVVEHAVFSLIVTGVSRSLSHELVRHRHLSPSQLSQRYVDESDAAFVVPPDLQGEVREAQQWRKLGSHSGAMTPAVHAGMTWLEGVLRAQENYVVLVSHMADKATRLNPSGSRTEARKYARQCARSLLPNATETKLFLTANVRAWRHFVEMRASRHAEPEIRKLAYAVYLALSGESPNFFSDYEVGTLWDGTKEVARVKGA